MMTSYGKTNITHSKGNDAFDNATKNLTKEELSDLLRCFESEEKINKIPKNKESKNESGSKIEEKSIEESKEISFGLSDRIDINKLLSDKFPVYSDDKNERSVIGKKIVKEFLNIANNGGKLTNILLPNNAGKTMITCAIISLMLKQCKRIVICVNTTLLRTQWLNYIQKYFQNDIAKISILTPGSKMKKNVWKNFKWVTDEVKSNEGKKYFIVFDEAFSKSNIQNPVYLAFKKFLGKLHEAVMPKGQKSKKHFSNVFLLSLGAPLDFSMFKEYYDEKNSDGKYKKYLDYLEKNVLGGVDKFPDPFQFIPVDKIIRKVYSVEVNKDREHRDLEYKEFNNIASNHLCTESELISSGKKIVIICPNRKSSVIVCKHIKLHYSDSHIIIDPPSEKYDTIQKQCYYHDLSYQMDPSNEKPVIVILYTGSFDYGIRFESMDRLILMPGVLKRLYVSEKKSEALTRKVERTSLISLLDRAGKNNSQVGIYITYSKNNLKNIDGNAHLKAWLGSESSCDHQIITSERKDKKKE